MERFYIDCCYERSTPHQNHLAALNVVVLVSYFFLVGDMSSDLEAVWVIPIWAAMLVLSFPSGIGWFGLTFALMWGIAWLQKAIFDYPAAGMGRPDWEGWLWFIFLWAGTFAVGYLQWF